MIAHAAHAGAIHRAAVGVFVADAGVAGIEFGQMECILALGNLAKTAARADTRFGIGFLVAVFVPQTAVAVIDGKAIEAGAAFGAAAGFAGFKIGAAHFGQIASHPANGSARLYGITARTHATAACAIAFNAARTAVVFVGFQIHAKPVAVFVAILAGFGNAGALKARAFCRIGHGLAIHAARAAGFGGVVRYACAADQAIIIDTRTAFSKVRSRQIDFAAVCPAAIAIRKSIGTLLTVSLVQCGQIHLTSVGKCSIAIRIILGTCVAIRQMASICIHTEGESVFGAFELRSGAIVRTAEFGTNFISITDIAASAALVARAQYSFTAVTPVAVAIVIAMGAHITSRHVMHTSIHAIG